MDTIPPTAINPTPGPWSYTDRGLVFGQAQDDADEAPFVCDVCVDCGMMTSQEEANAQLVASAPDLLAALEQAVAALNTAPRFAVPSLDTDSYAIAALCDRAIAKAKGGAQ
jgi:hypothetical protein